MMKVFLFIRSTPFNYFELIIPFLVDTFYKFENM